MENAHDRVGSEALVASRYLVKLLVDPRTGRLLDASLPAIEFYGYSREELGTLTAWDLDCEVSREEILGMLEAVVSGRERSLRVETSHTLRDGTRRAVLVYPDLVEGAEGRLVLATVVDVTLQRQAEEERRLGEEAASQERQQQAERRWKLALDGAGHGVWDWNLATDAVDYSSTWKGMLGYSEDEVAGHIAEWERLVHPEDLPRAQAALQAHIAGETPSYECVHRLLCRDGSWKWVLTRGSVLEQDEAGRPFRMVGTHTDVSAQKAVEEQLRHSEERLRLATEGAELGVWYWDFSSGSMEWSERCREHLSLPPGENPSLDRFYASMHPEDRTQVEGLIQGAREGRSEYRAEYRIVGPDGSVRWISAPGRVFLSAAGTLVAMGGVTQDITNRKQSEAALQASEQRLRESERRYRVLNATLETRVEERTTELVAARSRLEQALAEMARSEARYRIIFEQAPLGVAVIDSLTGAIYAVNERFAAIAGRTREEMAHIDWMQITHPDDVQEDLDQMARLNAGEIPGFHMDKRYLWPDGGVVWISMTIAPLAREPGQGPRHLCMIEDITQRRRLEQTLAESEARYRLALDATSEGLWDIDLRTGIQVVNDHWFSLLGYEPGEVEPDYASFLARVHPDDRDRFEQASEECLSGRVPLYECEYRVLTRSGQVRWQRGLGKVVERDSGGAAVRMVGTFIDITLHRALEEELRAARLAADAASAAKSEFLAHMSHEIRTPLNGVLGLAQVLGREALTEGQRDLVNRIQQAGHALLVILNDVLDLSKIEAGQLRLERAPFRLEATLGALDSLLGNAARAKGLSFRIEGPGAPVGPLVGDRMRLEQVLTNLLGNAIKFTGQGEVEVRVLVLEGGNSELRLRFEIRDTGIGIHPEDQARLFTPFTQADAGITRRFGGTGLGLAISRRLVELMGGRIGVESQLGVGSAFWFELPFGRALPEEVAPAPALVRPRGPRLEGRHLLVVDDSPMNRDLLGRLLRVEGARATLAADGLEAVRLLEAGPGDFDAVLMDLRMPVMDGLEATRRIRGELGLLELPVLVLTAGVVAEQMEQARAAGADEVLTKPLDLERLVECISRRSPSGSEPTVPPDPAGGPETGGEIPEIPGLDRLQAAATLGGNQGLFLHLLAEFFEHHADAAGATRRDLDRGDRASAARRMHTLRGNAGDLGARAVRESAAGLEAALDRGYHELDARLAALDVQLARLREACEPWLGRSARPSPADRAPALDAGRLAALRRALAARDLVALRLFEELRPALEGALDPDPLDRLGRAVARLRFDEALEVLGRERASPGPGSEGEVTP